MVETFGFVQVEGSSGTARGYYIYGFLPDGIAKADLEVSLPTPTCTLEVSVSPGQP